MAKWFHRKKVYLQLVATTLTCMSISSSRRVVSRKNWNVKKELGKKQGEYFPVGTQWTHLMWIKGNFSVFTLNFPLLPHIQGGGGWFIKAVNNRLQWRLPHILHNRKSLWHGEKQSTSLIKKTDTRFMTEILAKQPHDGYNGIISVPSRIVLAACLSLCGIHWTRQVCLFWLSTQTFLIVEMFEAEFHNISINAKQIEMAMTYFLY